MLQHFTRASRFHSRAVTLSPAVARALRERSPVVALESTIISHGMPFPQNVETALAVEADVRAAGATPATICIARGRVHVGIGEELLEELGRAGVAARKTSRRDFASVLAGGGLGATTVAGTMIAAAAANVRIFATGGVGGVHRGGESSWDVSADLIELGRTRVCVVCAGVKSLLDIPRTLEVLETQGVPVLALGTDEFPAFYSARSGVRTPERVVSTRAVAAMLAAAERMGLENGTLFAVPNPSPVLGADVEAAIAAALEEAAAKGIRGAEATPFLLSRVADLTGGASLIANIALVRNNARVAAQLAVELAEINAADAAAERTEAEAEAARARSVRAARLAIAAEGGGNGGGRESGGVGTPWGSGGARYFSTRTSASDSRDRSREALVFIGGAAIDTLARPYPGARLHLQTSNSGVVTQSAGGVARNIAEVVGRLGGVPVRLLTALGEDSAAMLVRAACARAGIDVTSIAVPHGARTAAYNALLDGDGELVAAIADMSVLDQLTPAALEPHAVTIADAKMVIIDANLAPASIAAVVRIATSALAPPPLVFEPISVAKATRVLDADVLHSFALIKPNKFEVVALAESIRSRLGLGPLPEADAGAAKSDEVGNGEGEEEEAGAGFVNSRLLVAAQTVLAAMLRTGGLAMPLSGAAEKIARRGLTVEAATAAALHGRRGGVSSAASGGSASPCGLIDGRKHVLVSLGEDGVLWLSARPVADSVAADLARVLPCFVAARSPDVDFDCQLIPAPPAQVRKATGAGDALLGATLWAIAARGERASGALRWGLAAAHAAIEYEPEQGGGGAVPATLSIDDIEKRMKNVGEIEDEYT